MVQIALRSEGMGNFAERFFYWGGIFILLLPEKSDFDHLNFF